MGGDAVQVFTQSPRTWRPTNHDPANFERFRERCAEAGVGAVLCHADLPPEPRVARRRRLREVRRDAREHRRSRLRDRGGRRRLPRGLAPRRGLRGRSRPGRAGSGPALEHCSDTTWLLLENSAGAGGTIGRSVDELALLVDALDAASPARPLPRLLPSLGVRRRRDRPGRARRDARRGRRADRARPAPRAARQRRRRRARLEPRPARERLRGRARRELGVFLGHARLQGLPAVLEVPGSDGHGPNADDVRKLAAARRGQLGRPDRAARDHAEGRRALRELEELGVHAAEPAPGARSRLRPRSGTSGAAGARRARRRSRPSCPRPHGAIEVDLDVVDLLHAADVGAAPLLVRVEERAGRKAGGRIDDLVAVDVAAAALRLVLRTKREVGDNLGASARLDCGENW